MNKFITLLCLFFIGFMPLQAQKTELLTDIKSATDLIIIGDELFYLKENFGGFPHPRTLFKINLLTSVNTELLDVPGAYSLLANGNDLFISGNNAISKIDLSQPILSLTNLISSSSIAFRGMEIKGNDIYVGTKNNAIYKFDITSNSPTLNLVVNSVSTSYDIEIIDNDLYISDYNGNQISKVDLTGPLPATPVAIISVNKPLGVDLYNGKLFVSSDGTHSIYYFNPSLLNPTLNTVLNTGLSGPDIGLAFTDTSMYIAEYSSDKISVFQFPRTISTITIDSNASCNGSSNGGATVHSSQGTPPYAYLWDNGDSTSTISNLTSGNYTVRITDDLGIVTIDSVTITEPEELKLDINIDSNATCFGYANGGASVIVNGGTPPYSYLWSNGETTPYITGVYANEYTITVTDANGCSSSTFETINQYNESQSFDIINTSTPFEWIDGNTYTESTYGPIYTYTNKFGCDSTVTLLLNFINYCSSQSTKNSYEWIKQVELESDIDNLSNKDINGYGDFTDQTLVVDTGDIVTVKLTPGYKRRAYVEYWRIWADWNFDGDFNDPQEKVFEQKGKNIRTGSFAIPKHVDPNELGLRISMRWKRYAPSCGNFRNGEVEDYRIIVNGAQGSPYSEQDGKYEYIEPQEAHVSFEFVDVFPNPVNKGKTITGFIRIEESGEKQITLVNTMGMIVKSKDVFFEEGENHFELSTSGINKGLYFMTISGGLESKKIIIQ